MQNLPKPMRIRKKEIPKVKIMKGFKLIHSDDDRSTAKALAKKFRSKGLKARTILKRYSPRRGAEYNLWEVWLGGKRKKVKKK